jgi:release factor glutamine methyltransferase
MSARKTIAESLAWSIPILDAAGIDSPRFDAALLLAWVLRARREDLARCPERLLTDIRQSRFDKAIELRRSRCPLPYITGEAWFHGRPFKVNRHVLIPRPETELLIDVTRTTLARRKKPSGPRVADIGTGTGCIGITLALEMPGTHVVATDISSPALRVAGRNVARRGVADCVELRLGSLCEPLDARERFDAIVSNPPYIDRRERQSLMPEVRDFEPEAALFGVDSVASNGCAEADFPRQIRRELFLEARHRLVDGGLIAVEVGAGQANRAADDARELGYHCVTIVEDGGHIGRVVWGLT